MSSHANAQPGHDLLHISFDRVLASFDCDDVDVFISRVAEDYLLALVAIGHVPMRYLESLRDDVLHEVQDILKVKSYGTLNFGEYLRHHQREKQRPSSA
jgi:hypothetical protein